MPYSAPEVPMITLSPITSGAMVSVYPAAGPSPTFTSHFTLPVVASSATRLSSSVPRNTDPPETATPRLLGPQQPRRRRLGRSEEHTSELQSRGHLVCRLLLEKKK